MSNHAQNALLVALLFAAHGLVEKANAAEIGASITAGVGASDNLMRNELDSRGDVAIGLLGFQLAAAQESRRWSSVVRAQGNYYYYDDSSIDSELLSSFDGLLDFTIIDEHLRWITTDTFGQQLRNPLEPPRPGNREDVNFVTTGPRFTMPIGNRTNLGVDLTYSNVQYEILPFDNDRTTAAVNIGREIRRDQNISLNVQGTRTKYKDETLIAPQFDVLEEFVRYAAVSPKSNLTIDVGYTVNSSDVAEDSNGLLFRVDFSRRISSLSTWTVGGATQFSDGAEMFRSMQNPLSDVNNSQNIEATGLAFRDNSVNTSLTIGGQRTRVQLFIRGGQEDYKQQTAVALDRDQLSAELTIRREFARNVFGRIQAGAESLKYKYQDRDQKDYRGSITLGYEFSPAFSTELDVQHSRRDDSQAEAGFEENRVFLRFVYRPAWARRGTAGDLSEIGAK